MIPLDGGWRHHQQDGDAPPDIEDDQRGHEKAAHMSGHQNSSDCGKLGLLVHLKAKKCCNGTFLGISLLKVLVLKF